MFNGLSTLFADDFLLAMKGGLWSGHMPSLSNIVPQFCPCFPQDNHKSNINFYGMLFMKTHTKHQEDIHICFTLYSIIWQFCIHKNITFSRFRCTLKWRLRI